VNALPFPFVMMPAEEMHKALMPRWRQGWPADHRLRRGGTT
jgi:hypothetical protein